jgi:hypothetical protein
MKRHQIFMIGTITLGSIIGTTLATIGSLTSPTTPIPSSQTAIQPSPSVSPVVVTETTTVAQTTQDEVQIVAEPRSTTSPSGQAEALQPVTQDFSQFRQRLMDAVQQRDSRFIRAIVTPQTQWSYGGTLNLDSYQIDEPDAEFWWHMEKAVRAGCAIDRSVQTSSQVWACPDISQAQKSIRPDGAPVYGETSVAILGEKVNIRSGAGKQYAAIGQISHQYLPIAGGQLKADFRNPNGWTAVQLANGQQGFVQNRYAYYAPTDYRVAFTQVNGAWRLHYFLPGNGN